MNAEFWVPEPDEIDEYEGFGLFQDVWPVTDVSVAEAVAVAREDRLLCRVVGDLARDAADFDVLAAASCRGHPEPDSWSAVPVVMFAADRLHAEMLQPLVESSGCGFDFDPVRPELLVVNGRSVEDTLRLAGGLIPGLARNHWCRGLRIAWPRQGPRPTADDGDGVVAVLMCGHHSC